jgi:outer membrane protein TolC
MNHQWSIEQGQHESVASPLSRACCGLLAFLVAVTVAMGGASAGPEDGDLPVLAEPLSADRFHLPDAQISELIRTLLSENPQILSVWAQSRSRYERVPQEKSLPDPQLTYRYFAQTPETRVGPQDQWLEINQGVPWGGKRGLQAQRAESLAAGTTWEAGDVERRLVAELKRAYFEAAYLQEALRVNSEEQEILRRFESIALRRYATGQGIQQSVVKVQTEISRLDDQQTRLREQLDAVVRRLSVLTGRPELPLSLGPIELGLPAVAYDRDDLETLAVANNPRVRAVERRIEADQIWAKRRKLESRPDFRFGVGYIWVGDREDSAGTTNPPEDNGKNAVSLTVGVNIPIFRKRIRAGVSEAKESEQADQELLQTVRDRLRFDVQEALLRIDSLTERGHLYRDVIVPQAEESLASAEAAYATDRLSFLDLLDAERILFQSRLAYHRLVSDLWGALADLELSIAQPFPTQESASAKRLGTTTGPTS